MQISDLKHRNVDSQEHQEINSQYQGGIEFIYWYHDMGETITDEKLLHGIQIVLSKLKAGLQFPIAEYNSSREVTTLLGFTLGEMLRQSFQWKWYYLEAFEQDLWGYTIVSPDEKFAICVENIFFKNVFYKREILFEKLSALLIKGEYPKFEKNAFEVYEPWNKDYGSLL